MKNSLKLLFFTLSIIISSCSSPEKDGNKRGMSFCNCLTDLNSYSLSYLLQSKKDSCDKASMGNLDKDYNTDAAKFKKFKDAFENTTQKTLSDYNSILAALITTELSGKVWVKEDETNNDFYLCSFNKGIYRLLNCKEDFDYKLNGDSIVFDDRKKTSGIIKVTPDKKLILSIPTQSTNSQYRLATDKDKLIGKWNITNNAGDVFCFIFFQNGSCTGGGSGYYSTTTTYSLNGDSILNIVGVDAFKMKMSNNDFFSFGWATSSRIKSKKPDNLKF